jgi:uncharacterized protein (DUF2345 family)
VNAQKHVEVNAKKNIAESNAQKHVKVNAQKKLLS